MRENATIRPGNGEKRVQFPEFTGERHSVGADAGAVAIRTRDAIWRVNNGIGDGEHEVLIGRGPDIPLYGVHDPAGGTWYEHSDLSEAAIKQFRFECAFELGADADVLRHDCGGWDGAAVATLHPGRWMAYRCNGDVALLYVPKR